MSWVTSLGKKINSPKDVLRLLDQIEEQKQRIRKAKTLTKAALDLLVLEKSISREKADRIWADIEKVF